MQLLCSSAKRRAHEVVKWRTYVEQQEKGKTDLEVIELKQKAHQDEYKKEREDLVNMTWREKKRALRQRKKPLGGNRLKERVDDGKNRLSIIIKGKVPIC